MISAVDAPVRAGQDQPTLDQQSASGGWLRQSEPAAIAQRQRPAADKGGTV